MTVVSTFNIGLQFAVEDAYNTAPVPKKYFQGGKWFDLTLDSLPEYQDRKATIFPAGSAGSRAINTRAPIVGRKWSDGSIGLPVSSDILAPLLYSVMGNVVSSAASGDVALTEASELSSGTEDYQVVQPVADQMLAFEVTAASDVFGNTAELTVVMEGVTANGEPLTEEITTDFSPTSSDNSNLIFVSRTSWLGGSDVNVCFTPVNYNLELTQISGFKYFEYTYTFDNETAPTLSMNRVGDPTAGSGNYFNFGGIVAQSLNINTPADQRDGLVTGGAQFEGHPGSIETNYAEQMITETSLVGVWPSWGLSFTKNGNSWVKAVNASIDISTGAQNYRSAAGVQTPQGAFFGGLEVTGAVQLLADDDDERLEWENAEKMELVANWTTPYVLSGSVTHGLTASMMGAYWDGDLTSSDQDNMYQLSGNYRCVQAGDDGLVAFSLRTNVPPFAVDGTYEWFTG